MSSILLLPHAHSLVKALIRDGYRCVVTGAYHPKLTTTGEVVPKVPPGILHCAYIFPESTSRDLEVVDKISVCVLFFGHVPLS